MSGTADPESTALTPEAQRIRDVFDMHEFGVQLFRQRMRRENPEADETRIEALTRDWLAAPPARDRVTGGDKRW